MPKHIVPMLARLSHMPSNEDEFGFEVKWDGIRAVLYSGKRKDAITLENRNLRDITFKYPELHGLAGLNAVVDGEIVALDENGRPSFERMQGRMHLSTDAAVRNRMNEIPVRFMAFDLIWHAGKDLTNVPYTERRAALEALDLKGDWWQTPSWRQGEGTALLDAARAQALEGVMAKRLDSPYCPGKRTKDWLKIKVKLNQEFVIGGWLPGEGRRMSTLGALLLGYYEGDQFRFAGRCGTGFKERDLTLLMKELKKRARDTSPYSPPPAPPRQSQFVEPELVAEVEFTEWTREGILRHPAYKGLRDDKPAKDVVREIPV
ncbi:MAG: bifunctional non-ous end joining protein LigD [Thermoleophilaceae bacterium]|jgi:bifunctional non-homologous end joining protein LigD|nr:bifunctional non-ous end joining protein LigD [Thermoleophilaceae bacterium]